MSNEKKYYGYQGKWLEVDLTKGSLKDRVFEEATLKKYLGSSAMGTKILCDETGPETDPLGPDNVIIFAAGFLNNTKALLGGRYQVISKSPLTNAFGEGNSGGTFGPALKRSGYDGVIVKGASEKPVYIAINNGVGTIESADGVWGRDSFETSDILQEKYGKKAVVACIGAGGENLVKYAAVMNDGHEARCVGRAGMGTVMGSKKLKAIVALGEHETQVMYPDKLNEDVKKIAKELGPSLKDNPFRKYGTPFAYTGALATGDLPIKNWSVGMDENMKKLTIDTLEKKMDLSAYFCKQCILGCGVTVQVTEGKYKSGKTGGPEYETMAMLGSNLLIDDIQAVQWGNELCNRYGIDTISAGSTIGWAIEAFEQGYITKEDTDGLELKWGDPDVMIELIHRIAKKENIGKLLAEGSAKAAEIIGGNSDAFAVHVRGLDFPAHDPRSHLASAIAYVTNPRGACHQASAHNLDKNPTGIETIRWDKALVPGSSEHVGSWVAELQNAMNMIDSLGACKFSGTVLGASPITKYTEWINAITGWELQPADVAEVGERIHNLKWLYNFRCGATRKDFKLPPRISTRKRGALDNAEHLPSIDIMLSDYFYQRGWSEFGMPLPETIERLGLEEYALADVHPGPKLEIG